MAYLDDHPPARSQFRDPRRSTPSGVVVVHTAENTPDFVAFDGGAEAVANFITQRTDPGSYHNLADSDSWIPLVRYDCEAFHDATGSNPHSFGVSGATRADVWPLAPPEWRAGCVRNMAASTADYAHWLRGETGIIIPAQRITREQSELRIPGFISHAERDPARRHDPGTGFPWNDYLAEFARLTAPPLVHVAPGTVDIWRNKTVEAITHPSSKRVDQVFIDAEARTMHIWAKDAWTLYEQPAETRGRDWDIEDLEGFGVSISGCWEHGGPDAGFVVAVHGVDGFAWTRVWYPTTPGWEPWRKQATAIPLLPA